MKTTLPDPPICGMERRNTDLRMYDDSYLGKVEAALQVELPHWGLRPDAGLRLLTVSENATFIADDGKRRVVLRVHRPDYHTPAEIQSELDWIGALRAEAIVETPAPVLRKDGALLGRFLCAGEIRHVVGFAFMTGREPAPSDDLRGWFRHLGGLSARLHEHSRRWTRPGGFTRKTWDFDTMLGANPHWGDWRAGPGLDDAGRAVLERAAAVIARRLGGYGKDARRFGLMHADLRLANLLVDGDRLGVIDFDDSGFSWFMYDFAAAISFHEHEPFVTALQDAWIEGYRENGVVAPEDEAMLPVFVMLRRILLTAWIASHAETPTAAACGTAYTDGTLTLAAAFLERHA